MPRIFKYGDIPNISFIPDKELKILIYRSPSYLIKVILFEKWSGFLPTLYLGLSVAVYCEQHACIL